MDEQGKRDEKKKLELIGRSGSSYLGKRISTSGDMLLNIYPRPVKLSDVGILATREQIAERAYFLWQKDGSKSGRDGAYWLQAEAELNLEIRLLLYQ